MNLPTITLRETFILRMWRDSGDDREWRGQIQSVSTGKTTAFHSLSTLFDYIKTQLDEKDSHQTPQGLR